MKTITNFLVVVLCITLHATLFSQESSDANDIAEYTGEEGVTYLVSAPPADNGFSFETFPTGINSKYSDYGIGFYRDKFISFSARKIGALAKIDPNTKEPYTKLYCSDITSDYDLKRPLLFSSLLNKNENLGTLAFANEGNTLYFTKSKEGNTQSFDLYRAEMSSEREGAWVHITKLDFNGSDYSIENPHVSRDGKELFFASNRPESIGGYDIFKMSIVNDHPTGTPQRLEGSINTVLDEKFPQTSLDGKYLYFSSTGHNSLGGYDVYRSRNARMGYVSVRNLGTTINTEMDELAYIQGTENHGYLTSNREGGKGAYDIYKIVETPIDIHIAGSILDEETQLPLENAQVVLLDETGEEVASVRSDSKGHYDFSVDAFLDYTLLSYIDKFGRNTASVTTNSNVDKTFKVDISLKAEAAPIVISEEKTVIQIDNIQFDYDSASIKDRSTITLNTVVQTLNENPEISIAILAHTDSQGSDHYNLNLSKKRAASAMKYLMAKGISQDRMSSKGFGESQLLITCERCSDEQNELNRRVEFVVVPKNE